MKRQRQERLFDDSEELPAVNVIDRVANPCWNRWFMGPTKIDFSMLPVDGRVQQSDHDHFRRWKKQDLAKMYYERNRCTQGTLWSDG